MKLSTVVSCLLAVAPGLMALDFGRMLGSIGAGTVGPGLVELARLALLIVRSVRAVNAEWRGRGRNNTWFQSLLEGQAVLNAPGGGRFWTHQELGVVSHRHRRCGTWKAPLKLEHPAVRSDSG